MRRPIVVYLLTQVVALSLACAAAAFVGLPLAGFLGGGAIGVAPHFAFGIVEPIVCPDRSYLEFTSIRRPYHRPGEAELHVECVAADGSRKDVRLPAVLSVLGVASLAAFVPVFVLLGLPLALVAYAGTRAILSRQDPPIESR